MESASPVRQSLRAAGKLAEELSASNDVGGARLAMRVDQSRRKARRGIFKTVVADVKLIEERLAKRTRCSEEEKKLRLLAAHEEIEAIRALNYARMIDKLIVTTGEGKVYLERRARVLLGHIRAKFKLGLNPVPTLDVERK